jgi:hypothetical protein
MAGEGCEATAVNGRWFWSSEEVVGIGVAGGHGQWQYTTIGSIQTHLKDYRCLWRE